MVEGGVGVVDRRTNFYARRRSTVPCAREFIHPGAPGKRKVFPLINHKAVHSARTPSTVGPGRFRERRFFFNYHKTINGNSSGGAKNERAVLRPSAVRGLGILASVERLGQRQERFLNFFIFLRTKLESYWLRQTNQILSNKSPVPESPWYCREQSEKKNKDRGNRFHPDHCDNFIFYVSKRFEILYDK